MRTRTHWSVAWLVLLCLIGRGSDAAVYRCVGEQGEPSFSRQPCEGGGGATRVAPAASHGRAAEAGLRIGERNWLARREAEKQSAKTPPRPRPKAATSPARKTSQAYRCLRKRRDLDALNAELRRGYKASRAPALHRRQREYRDYLSAFCP
jgi:hypothetical protein